MELVDLVALLSQAGVQNLIVILVTAVIVKKYLINGVAIFLHDSVQTLLQLNTKRVEQETQQTVALSNLEARLCETAQQSDLDRQTYLSHIAEMEAMVANTQGQIQAMLHLLGGEKTPAPACASHADRAAGVKSTEGPHEPASPAS